MNKEICAFVNTIVDEDGLYDTHIKSVKIYKSSTSNACSKALYEVCLILPLKGRKQVRFSDEIIEYNSQNYLVTPNVLPLECQTFATKEEPFIAVLIELNKQCLFELIEELPSIVRKKEQNSMGLFSDTTTPEIEDILLRLLKASQQKQDAKILGEMLQRELSYRILLGNNAGFLHRMFLNDNNEAKISRTIKKIHENYASTLDIATLAKEEDMSLSSFHAHFKNITSSTPLQYIKNVRLNKAKDMLSVHDYTVSQTAYSVGYETIPQFSKDFKNFFGFPPKEAKAHAILFHKKANLL